MQEAVTIAKELNIKGEVCPYTFVKTKLALEALDSGLILKIVVDHLPAVENVPKSLRGEGHEVLEVTQLNATDWQIIAKKR